MNQSGAAKPPASALGQQDATPANDKTPFEAETEPPPNQPNPPSPGAELKASYLSSSIHWSDGVDQWGLND